MPIDVKNIAASLLPINTGIFILHAMLILIAMASIVIYAVAMANWLPSGLYGKKRDKDMLFEKQKKRFDYPIGRSMIYAPTGDSKEYVKRYTLFTDEEKKYIKCEFDESVKTILFELAIYDLRGRIVSVTNVFAKPDGNMYSDGYELPDSTYYTNIAVLNVNGEDVALSEEGREKLKKKYSFSRARYALLTVAASLLEGALLVTVVKLLEAHFIHGSYATFLDHLSDPAFIIVPIVSLGIGAITSLIILTIHSNKKYLSK